MRTLKIVPTERPPYLDALRFLDSGLRPPLGMTPRFLDSGLRPPLGMTPRFLDSGLRPPLGMTQLVQQIRFAALGELRRLAIPLLEERRELAGVDREASLVRTR